MVVQRNVGSLQMGTSSECTMAIRSAILGLI